MTAPKTARPAACQECGTSDLVPSAAEGVWLCIHDHVVKPGSHPPAPGAGDLLAEVVAVIHRYVVLPETAHATAVALWVLHTWALDGAHATPYLLVVSPEKRAGKTRLLEVLELLIRKPWRVTSASEAAMFRKISHDRPTLLLDEVDAIFGSNTDRTEPLRAVINSGNRPGAAVARCVGDGSKQTVKDFNVYCPKVLAGIDTGRLPDTIRDRGVEIRMERKTAGEHVQRFRVRFAEKETKQLRAGLAAWAASYSSTLRAAVPELPEDLDDRAGESWEALFAIADLAGGDWPGAARRAAVELAGGERDDAPASAKALAAVHAAFNGHEAMATSELLSIINGNDELPFGGWNDGDGLKARDLARLLKRYRIKPRSVRLPEEDSTRKGYRRDQFGEAWERYLPPTPKSPAQAAQAAQPSPHGNGDVPDVPDVPQKSGEGRPPVWCSCASHAELTADGRCSRCFGEIPEVLDERCNRCESLLGYDSDAQEVRCLNGHRQGATA